MGEDLLDKRKGKLIEILKNKKFIWVYLAIILIAVFGFNIRTNNVGVLGGYLADPDAHAFYRYAKYIVENGHMPEIDKLRYYPLGFQPQAEFGFLSYFIAYLYKFLHIFNKSLTLEYIDIIYPAIAFIFGILFYFLLVRKLFDYRIALLASITLTVVPAFLFRTMSGVSDKEALALPLMFLSLYLYIASWQSKKFFNSIILALFSGIITAFTALTWGGVVYALVSIGGFAFLESLLNKFEKKDFITYAIWSIVTVAIMATLGKGRFDIPIIASSLTTGIVLLSLNYSLFNFLILKLNIFKLREKLGKIKIPITITTLIATILFIAVMTSIMFNPLFIFNSVYGAVEGLFSPQQDNRWSLTVAENHQVYFVNWFGDFTAIFVWMFIIASIWLFYDMVRNVEKYKWKLTFAYTIFILGFILSRYSPNSRLNGENTLSHFILLFSILEIFIYVLYVFFRAYYKDKTTYEQITNIDKKYSLIFIWFLLGIIGAKIAIRLVFPFAPIATFLFAFLVFSLVDYIRKNEKIKNNALKFVSYAIIGIVVLYMLFGFTKTTIATSKVIGPIYNQQWQMAGNWVKENTPKDAVFVHWWDYGYLVQTGFERATVTDGGNAIGPWNYYVGRLVLTAQNETEPLSFLKTHDVSYLLIVSDEIGKYPAFSSIGSNVDYDRYSWIGTYGLNPQAQETRNTTVLVYEGGVSLDEDFIYEGKIFPRQSAGIAGFYLPIAKDGNNSVILQPTAVLVYNGQPYKVPLECIFINDKEINFEQKGVNGCLRIIPSYDGTNINPYGAALYVSPKVRRTLFTKLYLYGQQSETYKLVYSDENSVAPLILYRGRLVGPIKIWKINYPDDVKTNPEYLETNYRNPEVTYVKKGYY